MKLLALLIAMAFGSISYAIQNGDYFVDNEGVKIWTHVSGQGPVCVVITPGWGASVDLYMSSMQVLEKSYTMVYMDDRGSGRSDKPVDAAMYAMSYLTSDIEAVRKFLSVDQICLIGHSMGGVIAAHYAAEYPESITKLYLISTALNINSQTFSDEFNKEIALRQNEDWYPAFVAAQQRTPTTDAEFKQQLLDMLPAYFRTVANMKANLNNLENETFSLAGFNGFYGDANPDEIFDLTPILPKITAKTYIFNGLNDPWGDKAEGDAMGSLVQGSTVVTFQNSGHFSWMEEADEFFSYF